MTTSKANKQKIIKCRKIMPN